MEPVLYSRWKLAALAALLIAVAVVFLMPFIDPDTKLPGIAGFLTSGWAGHFFIGPLVELGLLLTAWRIGMVAAGPLDAIVADAHGVRVTTMFKSVQIPWRDLILARLIVKRTRYGKRYHICFDRRSGASVRVSASLTTLYVDDYHTVIELLGQRQYLEVRKPVAVPSLSAAAVVAANTAPARRGFGRKGAPG